MRNHMRERLRVLLAILLSLVMMQQTVPMRAVAAELSQDTGVLGDARDATCDAIDQGETYHDATGGADGPQTTSDTTLVAPTATDSVNESAEAPDANNDIATMESGLADRPLAHQPYGAEGPRFASGMLAEGFVDGSGHRFAITLTYDESARIPEDARLVAAPYDGRYESYGWDMDACVVQALALGSMDSVLATRGVDISIMAEGQRVQPTNDVTVTIETDAFDSVQAPYLEAVAVDEATADVGGIVATALSAETRPSHVGGQPSSSSGDMTRDNGVSITIVTSRLGTISLSQVATRVDIWSGRGIDAWLWVPRAELDVRPRHVDAPTLDDGLDALACYGLDFEPRKVGGTTLLLEAARDDATRDASDAMAAAEGHGVTCYLADSSGPVSDEALFGPDGTESPVPFDAENRYLLLAWDSGLRNASISMGSITVEGLMPEGTDGVAVDVSDRYEDPTPLVLGAHEGLSAQSEASMSELTTVAAFDISLSADGVEYQPAEEHPLSVTIKDGALKKGADVTVIHVTDDGCTESISDFELMDGSISFMVTGFSTYLVAQEDDAREGRSNTFLLHARANTYGRSSTVRFVDTEKNLLMSTVTTTQYVTYTSSGTESNDANTIDMYKFIDRLDPDIADEYEFSRVFVQLSGMEKDFRFVQVADGTVTGEGDTIKRAYFYMNSVSENAKGRDYYGTWYALTFAGRMDDIYIEFYHVAPVSMRAIDTRGDPVVGAEFDLFTDPDCYVPLEYKGAEVVGVSDQDGNVSFGKIPRGTYYMKETVTPEGYKKTVDVTEIVVDGVTAIEDVVHEDDDGSIIISDILRMTLKKEWDDGEDRHAGDSVEVEVHARGETVAKVTLDADNNWTQTIEGLDPNEPYMVSETSVTCSGVDATNDWIPDISYVERDPHVEYYKASQFRQGKQYVILTTTASGTRALVGKNALATIPLEANDAQVTGTVTDDMVWSVDTLTRDGVIALKNDASGSYLDQNGKWYLNPAYPEPLYIRHLNDDGTIKFYHRPNLNKADSYYLYIYYQKDGSKAEGAVDRYKNNESGGAEFALYQKVNVRSADVTIANRTSRYPIAIKSVAYPAMTSLPDVTFDLYTQAGYEASGGTSPLMRSLVAGADGYLRDGTGSSVIDLGAGTYYLCRTSDLSGEGYVPLAPLKFTITRGGALRVARDDQEIAGFAYSTTGTVAGKSCPILQVPAHKEATVELTFEISGDMADMTREFMFELAMPQGVQEISAKVADVPVTLSSDNASFVLGHGQSVVLEDVPSTVAYQITQTSDCVAASSSATEGLYVPEVSVTSAEGTVTVSQSPNDMRVVTLTGIVGTKDHPARVTLTNRLEGYNAPDTGIDDNTSVWVIVVLMSLVTLVMLRGGSIARRRQGR